MKILRPTFALLFAILIGASSFASQIIGSPQTAIEIGKKAFAGKSFGLSWIPSNGTVADATFIAASAAEPSKMARELAHQIASAAAEEVNLVVAGPNSSKSKCVLLDAIKATKKQLPKLRVLFLGADSDTKDVDDSLQRVGAVSIPAPVK